MTAIGHALKYAHPSMKAAVFVAFESDIAD